VLMDTMMPEMDGLSAIQAIRRMPRHRDLPILSLTAKAMKGDREAALAAGASDYVAKPVDPERLLSVIHHWLTRSGALAAAGSGAAGTAEAGGAGEAAR
jgi:CheY-like chemotaxis protein